MIFIVVFLTAWFGIYGPCRKSDSFTILVTGAAAFALAYSVAFIAYH